MDIDVGDCINGALVLITLWVARQATRSADAAAAELALARRPLVLISKCDVGTHTNECGAYLVAHVTFRDAAGVPATLHSVKIAIHFQNYVGIPEELASGILLYRSLKYVAEKAVDWDDAHVGSTAHVAYLDVTYLFSAEGDHRCQEWHCRTGVYRGGDKLLCYLHHPRITRDDWRDEREPCQCVRRIVKWWKQMKAEMGAPDC